MPFSEASLSLTDILDAIIAIEQFTQDRDLDSFRRDPKTIAAVERKLQVISEAAVRLGEQAEALCPGLPWRDIRGIGNCISSKKLSKLRTNDQHCTMAISCSRLCFRASTRRRSCSRFSCSRHCACQRSRSASAFLRASSRRLTIVGTAAFEAHSGHLGNISTVMEANALARVA